MARIRLFSHAASDTLGRLKNSLTAAGHSAVKLKTTGSTYRGAAGDFVFNYGSSSLPASIAGQATVINRPEIIEQTSNKRTAFARMEQALVRTVDYTTQRSIAEGWMREGALVYVRTQLQGHSGAGIELAHATGEINNGGFTVHTNEVPQAPLYTKGISGSRREYRVHVFNGRIIHVAQKRRRDGFANISERNDLVRNHHTGWVYSTQNMTALNIAGKNEALKAMSALGLDFGAVDVITRNNEAWILEVNTAPGMEGVTLEKYTQAITEYCNTGAVSMGETVEGFATFRQVNNNATAQRDPSPMQQNETRVAEQQPTTRAIPPAPTARQATSQPQAATAPSARAGRTSLTNGGYYWLTFNGEETIGKYNSSVSTFEIIGWEVPVEQSEVTVGARITR